MSKPKAPRIGFREFRAVTVGCFGLPAGVTRCVLAALVGLADKDTCKVVGKTQVDIAVASGTSRAGAERALKHLCDLGLIVAERSDGKILGYKISLTMRESLPHHEGEASTEAAGEVPHYEGEVPHHEGEVPHHEGNPPSSPDLTGSLSAYTLLSTKEEGPECTEGASVEALPPATTEAPEGQPFQLALVGGAELAPACKPKPRKAKVPSVDWKQVCADTYAKGISAGQGGQPFRAPKEQINGLFWGLVNVHALDAAGAVLREDALLAWLRPAAEQFRRSRHSPFEVQNLAIKDFGKWLDAGRHARALSRAEAARQEAPTGDAWKERQARGEWVQKQAQYTPEQLAEHNRLAKEMFG